MKHIKRFSFVLVFALVLSLTTPTLFTPAVPISEAATVKINKSKLTLEAGKTAALKISGTKQKVKWKSSNKSVATVGLNSGKVTAKKKGAATITATVNKKKYTCKVTVKQVDYSKWITFKTDNFDIVRDGLLTGEVVHYEDEYYLVSPAYYKKVIKPIMDQIQSSEDEYGYPGEIGNVLDPDAEYIIIDEDEDSVKADEEALNKRIKDLLENGGATS